MVKRKRYGIDSALAQTIINIYIGITIFLVMLPVFITIILSFKSNYDLAKSVWSFPTKWLFSNWKVGFDEMIPNMINSILIALVTTFITLLFGSVASFVFVRLDFFGKKFLYSLLIALMLVPSIITLTPLYVLCVNLNINNTWFALWFPSISGGQVGAIFLFTTFFGQQPKDIYDAAEIDGANPIKMYITICLPLSVSVLCIQAVGSFSGAYNDFMWPSIIISNTAKQPLMPVLRNLANVAAEKSQKGAMYAMYLLSSIPLIFATAFGLKYFVSGDFAAGLKL